MRAAIAGGDQLNFTHDRLLRAAERFFDDGKQRAVRHERREGHAGGDMGHAENAHRDRIHQEQAQVGIRHQHAIANAHHNGLQFAALFPGFLVKLGIFNRGGGKVGEGEA